MNTLKLPRLEGSEVSFHQVSYIYPGREGAGDRGKIVLDNISFKAEPGTVVSIVGQSGCGKSTLLRLAAGLLSPTSGKVAINSQGSQTCKISFVFQDPVLLPWRTVRENVSLPGEVGLSNTSQADVEQMIQLVGLKGSETSFPAQLSGGMRSRVAIARALVTQPDVILMDESFADLDELMRERLALDFLELAAQKTSTVLFVTHNISEAVLLSDQVLVLGGAPARILLNKSINLPRPRIPSHRETPEYLEALRCIRGELESKWSP
jgi:NitT/TauT family transport system ATP-binding protein